MSFGRDIVSGLVANMTDSMLPWLLLLLCVVSFIVGWELGDTFDIVRVAR